jgi:hypothetical protein
MSATPTTEASIQATLKHALETLGYIVLEVAKGRSASAKGAWTGTTPGTPDVFVSHPDWPEAMWLALELKTPTGKIRKEQLALLEKKRSYIVRGVPQGLYAVLLHEDGGTQKTTALCSMIQQFGGLL